jgi:exopolysaccharide biosynthesis polyprenyl glycosylphosphotransferase
MFRRFSVNFAIFSIALDSVLVGASLFTAGEVRPLLDGFGLVKEIGPGPLVPWVLYPVFILVWVGVFLGGSLYDGRKHIRRVEEFTAFSLVVVLAVIGSAGVLYLTYRELSRALFLLFVILAVVSLGGWRALYRIAASRQQAYRRGRRVLVVGDGEVGEIVRSHIRENQEFNLEFVGFVGDRESSGILGTYDAVVNLVEEHNIDHVVIALPPEEHQLVGKLVGELFDKPVRVWVVPDYLSLALHKAGVEEYAGVTMLDLRAPAINDYQRMVKRGFDLVVSALLLPFVLPVIGILALFILALDGRPIFYVAERAGENGKSFRMIKFRTMVTGAEKLIAPGKKERGDPRVTKVGRFLRRTSLDELPQIINVLKGEMSLVGPRPEMMGLVDQYADWQRTRFAVPPGITGWWQVNGRSDRPMHLHTEDDLYYINNYSIWLDLQILVRTAWVVILGRGAY